MRSRWVGSVDRLTAGRRPGPRRRARRRSRSAGRARRAAPGPPRACAPSPAGSTPPTCCPTASMSSDDRDVSGSLSCLTISSMIRMFAWCGMNAASRPAVDAGGVQGLLRDRRHLPDGPPEHALALLVSAGHPARLVVAVLDPRGLLTIACHWEPSEPQMVGPMPGVSDRADDDRAGAVAEDERGRAVVQVDEVGHLLGADDQHVAARCRRGPCRRPGRCRSRSRRTRRRCRSAAAGVAPIRWASSAAEDGVWYGCVTVATRTASMSAPRQPGALQRDQARPARPCRSRTRRRPAQRRLTMPGPLPDPLVGGVDRLDELVVVTTRSGR